MEALSILIKIVITVAGVALILGIPIFLIARGIDAREKDKKEIHKKVAAAKMNILEDGIVEGPKGPYVPHQRWSLKWPTFSRNLTRRSISSTAYQI